VIAADPARCGATGDLDPTARALRVAALRETFEECGVLLARPRGGSALLDGQRCADITAKSAGRSFAAMLDAEDLELALDTLTPFAHWVTPPIMPKRFDTHFYVVAAPEDQIAMHDGSESVDSIWLNPAEGLAAAKAGKYTVLLPTRLNLQMLGESPDVASALAAARARKIVTVEPVAVKDGKSFSLTIPLEAGYGGPTFSM